VAYRIGSIGIVAAREIVGADDAIRGVVEICVHAEKRMVQIDSCVDDDHRFAAAVNAGKMRVAAKVVEPDQSPVGTEVPQSPDPWRR
jgi:hypothetical protein